MVYPVFQRIKISRWHVFDCLYEFVQFTVSWSLWALDAHFSHVIVTCVAYRLNCFQLCIHFIQSQLLHSIRTPNVTGRCYFFLNCSYKKRGNVIHKNSLISPKRLSPLSCGTSYVKYFFINKHHYVHWSDISINFVC